MEIITPLHSGFLAGLPPLERQRLLASLTEPQALALIYDWPFWARPEQLPPPGDWRIWLVTAGRGYGKTRLGAEWARAQVERGACRRLALVGATAADARDVMVEGQSGILAVCPPWFRPDYEPSKRRLTWPNGAIATTYSADEPDRLRGPQHDGAWCDEPAVWRHPEAWDTLMLGLRLGADPRCVATTTPKRVPWLRSLLARAGQDVVVTRGSTYENRDHLAPAFIEQIVRQYEGTRLGRQELYAEILEDVEGALWQRDTLERARVAHPPPLARLVVAIDPAATSGAGADETGIVVCGLGGDGHGYVLDDLTLRASPDGWARRAVLAYHRHQADRVVAESTQGGEMVEHTLRTVDPLVPLRLVHASRGKQTRAEPIAALYEQGRVHHVGMFAALEDQMCSWLPGDPSPDRMDALVWALTDLMLGAPARIVRAANPFFG